MILLKNVHGLYKVAVKFKLFMKLQFYSSEAQNHELINNWHAKILLYILIKL